VLVVMIVAAEAALTVATIIFVVGMKIKEAKA
jgi:hypothetical protein